MKRRHLLAVVLAVCVIVALLGMVVGRHIGPYHTHVAVAIDATRT